jgi:hypothetical protein
MMRDNSLLYTCLDLVWNSSKLGAGARARAPLFSGPVGISDVPQKKSRSCVAAKKPEEA